MAHNQAEAPRKERPNIPNVLADRYASTEMLVVFSPEQKIIAERNLWIAVMKAQAELGIDIPTEVIAAYEVIKDQVDLGSIRERELILRHDEKAKLEEFNALAGHESAHLGLTSRDQSDNVEQMQIRDGLVIIRTLALATLTRLSTAAAQLSSQVYVERTHNAIAQPSLLGKLFSNTGEDLLIAVTRLENLVENYPLRGIKGAVGTQTDQLKLFKGDKQKVAVLEQKIAQFLGFEHVLGSVGQVYPRSLDFEVTSTLLQLVAGIGNLATTLRLMTGQEQYTEGFKPGQVGSTAMPYKMNARSCERIKGLIDSLKGFVLMTMNSLGNQWYGGDVSDSSTRRVSLPDAFFATDGIFQTMITILDEGGFYPALIEREIAEFMPFLGATALLMLAVQKGVGREVAHKAIKEHSVAVALARREQGKTENDLVDRLAQDERLGGLTREEMQAAIAHPEELVGTAAEQIIVFVQQVGTLLVKYPEATEYMPEEIL